MEKTKVAVIGLGSIAQLVHLPNLSKLKNVKLTAVAESNRNKLNSIADKFKIEEKYSDHKELLKKSDADVVIIATPTNTHKELAIAALKAGKDILVEKPLTRKLVEVKPVIDAAEKNNKKIMVGMNLRFRPDAMLLKSLITSGEIGEPTYIKASWVRRQSSQGKWFTQKTESGGGVILDLGILLLDLSLWLLDFPAVQSVSTQNFSTETKSVEDTSVSIIRCKKQCLINLETSWTLPVDKDTFTVTVYGTKGSASISPFKVFKKIDSKIIELSPKGYENPITLFRKSYVNELNSFIGAVRGHNPLISHGKDAFLRMKIIEAMYKSASQRNEVKI